MHIADQSGLRAAQLLLIGLFRKIKGDWIRTTKGISQQIYSMYRPKENSSLAGKKA